MDFFLKFNIWPPGLVFVMHDWTLHKQKLLCTCVHVCLNVCLCRGPCSGLRIEINGLQHPVYPKDKWDSNTRVMNKWTDILRISRTFIKLLCNNLKNRGYLSRQVVFRFEKRGFWKGAVFKKRGFRKGAVFEKCSFWKGAVFKKVRFLKSTVFKKVQFSKRCGFQKGAVFEKAQFSKRHGFQKGAVFKRCSFCGFKTMLFSNSAFCRFKTVVFKNHTFCRFKTTFLD